MGFGARAKQESNVFSRVCPVHLGTPHRPQPCPEPSTSPVPYPRGDPSALPPDLFKLVHLKKREVGLRLKGLLVFDSFQQLLKFQGGGGGPFLMRPNRIIIFLDVSDKSQSLLFFSY